MAEGEEEAPAEEEGESGGGEYCGRLGGRDAHAVVSYFLVVRDTFPADLPSCQELGRAVRNRFRRALPADGPVRIRFVPRNDLGVLDHEVTTPSGSSVQVPMRAVAHPEGTEVIFTLRQLGLSHDEFERDAATVQADLERLADILETPAPRS